MIKENSQVITKNKKKEESIHDHNHISRLDVQLKNVILNEYTINDILFNVLSLHYVGCLSMSPLASNTLVPHGPLDNQTCFVYAGPNFPSYQVFKVTSK